MTAQNPVENVDIIVNRMASDLERLKAEIDKLLIQLYGSIGAVAPGTGDRKTRRMTPPSSGLKYPEVRNLIIDLRGKLYSIDQILKAIKKRWPGSPEKHVSKSSIHRFIMMAKQGRLDYYDGFDFSKQNQEN